MTAEALDAFRHEGDRLADEVIEVFVHRRLRGDPVDRLAELAHSGDSRAQALWSAVNHVPDWVDFGRMQPGFHVALRSVVPSGLALMAGSLIESYASGKGAKVLVATGRLRTDTVRRLFETAKFAGDLALWRGARPGNPAWRNVVAVRLMHARVRYALRNRRDWDHQLWGLPINQEDYASTLFMFSLVYRRSLERLGVTMNAEEHAGAHLNWRYVGWLMGVDPALLSRDCAEEQAMYQTMRRRNFDPDQDSRALAHGLLEAMSGRPPFFLPEDALHALSRRLVGDELADAFGLRRSRVWPAALEAMTTAIRAGDIVGSRLAPTSVRAGEHLTRAILRASLPGGTRFE